jgi:tetratricopeptide (TPR) repeat protein
LNKLASTLLATLLLAAPVRAQDPKAAAKIHFDKGQREYDLGNFDAAVKEFEEAYRLFPSPALLFNLGQAHRKLGSNERALFFYRGYLRNMPSAPNRAEVEQWIAEMERPQPAPAPAPVPATTPPPADEPVVTTEQMPEEPPTDRSKLRRIGYWTLGASGVVLGAGVAFGLLARSKSKDAEDAGRSGGLFGDVDDGIQSNGKTYEKLQIGCLIAGGVGAVTGGVLVFLGWPQTQHVAVGPSSLVFSGSF